MDEYLHEQSEEAVTVSTYTVGSEKLGIRVTLIWKFTCCFRIQVNSAAEGHCANSAFQRWATSGKGEPLVQLINDDDMALLKALEAEAKLAKSLMNEIKNNLLSMW